MKKIITLLLVLFLTVGISGCNEAGSGGSATVDTGSDDAGSSDSDSSDSDDMADITADDGVDDNADDPVFEQTGTQDESVTITQGEDTETVVVDLGDLVTLEIYSEYLSDVHLYNEDLYVDTTVTRGNTVELVIEANEEGIFMIVDGNSGAELVKFIVAGTSFG
jgi:hypothetical protein